jgi:hypothetical protein
MNKSPTIGASAAVGSLPTQFIVMAPVRGACPEKLLIGVAGLAQGEGRLRHLKIKLTEDAAATARS